jgi:hypothetical protein
MRGADQRFPMTPYGALFTVTHRNESGTGRANRGAHKTLILCEKSANFLSDVKRVPAADSAQRRSAKMIT